MVEYFGMLGDLFSLEVVDVVELVDPISVDSCISLASKFRPTRHSERHGEQIFYSLGSPVSFPVQNYMDRRCKYAGRDMSISQFVELSERLSDEAYMSFPIVPTPAPIATLIAKGAFNYIVAPGRWCEYQGSRSNPESKGAPEEWGTRLVYDPYPGPEEANLGQTQLMHLAESLRRLAARLRDLSPSTSQQGLDDSEAWLDEPATVLASAVDALEAVATTLRGDEM